MKGGFDARYSLLRYGASSGSTKINKFEIFNGESKKVYTDVALPEILKVMYCQCISSDSQNTSITTSYTWRIEAAATNAHIIYFGSFISNLENKIMGIHHAGPSLSSLLWTAKYCVVMPVWNPLCDKAMFREGMICGTQKTLVRLMAHSAANQLHLPHPS
ncbi:hypothetical protein C4D60_Mb07t23050 [Musa balbisiana]|uniref:Uncharacterized protein n=1 Tax=Musa balbisiana TaxID=52838 RepID=A0A4V4H6V8_MUSBA|nr:hypothetical protein C4D60_Mb07t23050 [Musa balbisiana]